MYRLKYNLLESGFGGKGKGTLLMETCYAHYQVVFSIDLALRYPRISLRYPPNAGGPKMYS
jgi:hypothetical protein